LYSIIENSDRAVTASWIAHQDKKRGMLPHAKFILGDSDFSRNVLEKIWQFQKWFLWESLVIFLTLVQYPYAFTFHEFVDSSIFARFFLWELLVFYW